MRNQTNPGRIATGVTIELPDCFRVHSFIEPLMDLHEAHIGTHMFNGPSGTAFAIVQSIIEAPRYWS